MFSRIVQQMAFSLGLVALVSSANAQDASGLGDGLTEVPVLTVSGETSITNGEETFQFDRTDLEKLHVTRIETHTIWTEDSHVFQGVALVDLLQTLGVTQGTILATAINDYAVEIPVSDAAEGGPIVAYLMDGAEMSVREKGPLWIVYPYDSDAAYRTEVIYSRSIWQLNRLEFIK